MKGAVCARSNNGNTTLNSTDIGHSNEEKGKIKKLFDAKCRDDVAIIHLK